MEYRETIEIDGNWLDKINTYLTIEPSCAEECLDEDDTIIYTAKFENGMEMDIKCCGVQYNPDAVEDGDTNTAWSEAVLFRNGCEVANEYGEDSFEGEWAIEHDGDMFIADVVRA